ncbi:MAG: hypothetical protein AAFP19_25015, partial [Bacteroidota bacterium]
MRRSKIGGIGYYVPEKVVSNHDLVKVMDTSDEWIQERTGIVERRYAVKHKETTASMGAEAVKVGSIAELEEQLIAARGSTQVRVIVIDTDPGPSTEAGGSW